MEVLRLKYSEGFITKTPAIPVTLQSDACSRYFSFSGGFWSEAFKATVGDWILEFSFHLLLDRSHSKEGRASHLRTLNELFFKSVVKCG